MNTKIIKLFLYSSPVGKIELLKLFIGIILLYPINISLRFISYVGLVFSYKFFLNINALLFNLMVILNPVVKGKLYDITKNLRQIFSLNEKEDNLTKLAYKSLENRYYDSLVFSDIFLFLIRKNRFLNISLSMRLHNDTDLKFPYCGKRKIIFCHMHTSNKISSIIKIESMVCKKLKTLYLQRSHSKKLRKFIQSINVLLGKKNVSTYDPFHQSSTGMEFFRKVKQSDIVHTYVDFNEYLALKKFSTTKINFLGKSTFVVDGVARFAIATKSICIPVFVNDDDVHLLPMIDTLQLNSHDKVHELMQSIYSELSIVLVNYPEKWNYLDEAETFFRNIKFKE